MYYVAETRSPTAGNSAPELLVAAVQHGFKPLNCFLCKSGKHYSSRNECCQPKALLKRFLKAGAVSLHT
jgi:hypothetical protein